jgi:hypothetical protein
MALRRLLSRRRRVLPLSSLRLVAVGMDRDRAVADHPRARRVLRSQRWDGLGSLGGRRPSWLPTVRPEGWAGQVPAQRGRGRARGVALRASVRKAPASVTEAGRVARRERQSACGTARPTVDVPLPTAGRTRMTATAVDSSLLARKVSRRAGREPDWRGRGFPLGGGSALSLRFLEVVVSPSLILRASTAGIPKAPAAGRRRAAPRAAGRGFKPHAALGAWRHAR